MAEPLLNALDLMTMEGLDRPSYIEDPEDILAQNRIEELLALKDVAGTIGPIPYHETDEFRQQAFNIAEGLAFPGAGIGASISGGRLAKISEDMWQARGQKLLGKAARNLGRGTKEIRTIDASGNVAKRRINKTDLDYAMEKIPWWRELRKRGIRFLEGRGEKSFWNKPEQIPRTTKPPIVSGKQFKEGISSWPSYENTGDFYYWQDYFTNAIKEGVSSKSLQKKYGKVFTDWQANPETMFESHARRVKIAKDQKDLLLREEWARDTEYLNKMAKAKIKVQQILKKYDIDDPDIYRDLNPSRN